MRTSLLSTNTNNLCHSVLNSFILMVHGKLYYYLFFGHFESLFQVRIFAQVEQILYDSVLKVGREFKPMKNNLKLLNLPLIGNDYDKEDIMLATAFALGDDDLVDKVTRLFPKQQLGIGLKKFSASVISHVIKVLESIEEPNIDIGFVGLLVSLGVYDSDFREGTPKLAFVKDEYVRDVKQVWDVAKTCGFHVMNLSHLNRSVKRYQSRMQFQLTQHKCTNDDQVMLTNFHCNFETPINIRGDYCSPDFSSITLLKNSKKAKMVKPDEDAIADLFSRKIAARMAQVAAKRLRLLVSQCDAQGLSHEHIAVSAGYNGGLLKTLEESDQTILSENGDKIRLTLSATLEKNIPPPEDNEVNGKLSSSKALETEITQFIGAYLKLISLSYCAIPRLSGGAPPSSFVPEFSVRGEALEKSGYAPKPMLVHGTRRILVKDERERIVRSRKLVAPRMIYSLAFIGLSWMLVWWICFLASEVFMRYLSIHVHNAMYPLAIGQGFCLWTLYALVGILKPVCHLDSDSSAWDVVKCCVEFIYRVTAMKCGQPEPYFQELRRLRDQCQQQYRAWKGRIAKQGFYEALKRKRITNRECLLLMTEFAHTHVEKNGEEIVEGVLPVTLSEAEEFLKMEVDESEVALDSVKNYLSTGQDEGGLSAIEGLDSLSANVRSCVEFFEGDRVVVSGDEHFFDEEEDETDDDEKKLESNSSALVCRRSQTGSVVFSTATLCFIMFDGESHTTPVPIGRCSILDENEKLAEYETDNEDSSTDEHRDFSVASASSDDDNVLEEETHTPIQRQAQQPKARTVKEALEHGGVRSTFFCFFLVS